MNICSFIGCSCHPAELGTFPNRKSVIRQFNAVNSPETTPKEIFLSSILYIERINGILYIDFIAAEHLSMICKRTFGLIGSGTSDTTGPFATPDRHGIIKHVFITYLLISGAQSPPLGSKSGRVPLVKAVPTYSHSTKSFERWIGKFRISSVAYR